MPPLASVERLLLDSGYDVHQGSFTEQCERLREHLRQEITLAREAREEVPGASVTPAKAD
jgi:hypothetical protein